MAGVAPKSVDNWQKHITGAAALLQIWESRQNLTFTGVQLSLQLRAEVVVSTAFGNYLELSNCCVDGKLSANSNSRPRNDEEPVKIRKTKQVRRQCSLGELS